MSTGDAFKTLSKKIWEDMCLLNKSIEEKSLTIDVLKELKRLNSDRLLAIKGVNENKFGADLEWWIVFPGNENYEPEAVHLRIQAKRLHIREDVDHVYGDLDHKKGKQLNDLITEANSISAIPLYCFYNYYVSTPNSYKKVTVPENDGWSYTYAAKVKHARDKSFPTFNHLSTIDPLTWPMHQLGMMAEKNPSQILSEYTNSDGSISTSQLIKKELPDYVFKELEDWEYPNGQFFKHKDWFPGISKLKKKNRTEKSKRVFTALVSRMLNYLMYLTDSKKRRRLHLIISIAEEPINIGGKQH